MRGATAALLGTMLASLVAGLVAAEPAFSPGGQTQISAVADGSTLALADGRTLRLVGIDTPMRGALAQQAKAALKELVAGGTIELRFAGNPRDRQGRVLAQVYAGGLWVQGELLRRGLARVRSAADNRVGVRDMLALERQARRYHRGLWSDRAYVVLEADDAAKFAGTYQLVSGTVAAVENASGRIFVRLGDGQRNAFALTIAAQALKLCRDGGLDPMGLKGKRILVRGFIDGTARPSLTITHPEQIEVLARKK